MLRVPLSAAPDETLLAAAESVGLQLALFGTSATARRGGGRCSTSPSTRC